MHRPDPDDPDHNDNIERSACYQSVGLLDVKNRNLARDLLIDFLREINCILDSMQNVAFTQLLHTRTVYATRRFKRFYTLA